MLSLLPELSSPLPATIYTPSLSPNYFHPLTQVSSSLSHISIPSLGYLHPRRHVSSIPPSIISTPLSIVFIPSLNNLHLLPSSLHQVSNISLKYLHPLPSPSFSPCLSHLHPLPQLSASLSLKYELVSLRCIPSKSAYYIGYQMAPLQNIVTTKQW